MNKKCLIFLLNLIVLMGFFGDMFPCSNKINDQNILNDTFIYCLQSDQEKECFVENVPDDFVSGDVLLVVKSCGDGLDKKVTILKSDAEFLVNCAEKIVEENGCSIDEIFLKLNSSRIFFLVNFKKAKDKLLVKMKSLNEIEIDNWMNDKNRNFRRILKIVLPTNSIEIRNIKELQSVLVEVETDLYGRTSKFRFLRSGSENFKNLVSETIKQWVIDPLVTSWTKKVMYSIEFFLTGKIVGCRFKKLRVITYEIDKETFYDEKISN